MPEILRVQTNLRRKERILTKWKRSLPYLKIGVHCNRESHEIKRENCHQHGIENWL